MSTRNQSELSVLLADQAEIFDASESGGRQVEDNPHGFWSAEQPYGDQNKSGASHSLFALENEVGSHDENFKPLTRQEAAEIRRQVRSVSVMRVLVVQVVTGVVVAMISWGVTGRQSVGWSALYGALAVVVPAALFARGLSRQKSASDSGSALVGFFVWELVKIGVTVAMLLAAPRLVSRLSWLALLAGFVVTMKVYWLAMWFQLGRDKSIKNNG